MDEKFSFKDLAIGLIGAIAFWFFMSFGAIIQG